VPGHRRFGHRADHGRRHGDSRALVSSRPTFFMALIYMTNWRFIFHHVAYFQTFGPPPLLLHRWP
jgi:hypothetical protein